MTLTTQFYTMLAMVGMGSFLGVTLDTYGRFLKRPKRAKWLVFINDILFWLMQGLIIFYVLLMVDEGELRFYIFIALLCGYAAYQSMMRQYYIRLLEYIIHFVVITYRFLDKTFRILIVKPLRFLIQLFIVIVITLGKFSYTILQLLLKVVLLGLKILFSPLKWIILLLWRLIPVKYKYTLRRIFIKIAGIFKKVKNINSIFINWWKNKQK